MRYDVKWMVLAAASLAAAACTPVDAGFGEATRYDMAIQTIDPDPVYPEGSAEPGSHGEKAAKATERYRKGTTIPVVTMTTSSGGGGPQ